MKKCFKANSKKYFSLTLKKRSKQVIPTFAPDIVNQGVVSTQDRFILPIKEI